MLKLLDFRCLVLREDGVQLIPGIRLGNVKSKTAHFVVVFEVLCEAYYGQIETDRVDALCQRSRRHLLQEQRHVVL